MLDIYPSALVAAADFGFDLIKYKGPVLEVFADKEEGEAVLEGAALSWLKEHFSVKVFDGGIIVE